MEVPVLLYLLSMVHPTLDLRTQIEFVGISTQEHVRFPHAPTNTFATSAEKIIQPCNILASSSVDIDRFRALLSGHPNYNLVDYVVNGLSHGFSIGFSGDLSQSAKRNLLSAYDHYEAVSTAIALEVSRGHTLGPFQVPPLPNFHCSPIGAVEKDDGTVRLILDLSSPRGSSVNEGISAEEYSVKYCSFDDAVSFVLKCGRAPYMAKADIKHAFRLCPVSPDEWNLLGYQWDSQYYLDARLPFGSRSSPFIFNSFADLACWALHNFALIQFIIHYLDDFFWCSPSPRRMHVRHGQTYSFVCIS